MADVICFSADRFLYQGEISVEFREKNIGKSDKYYQSGKNRINDASLGKKINSSRQEINNER